MRCHPAMRIDAQGQGWMDACQWFLIGIGFAIGIGIELTQHHYLRDPIAIPIPTPIRTAHLAFSDAALTA